MYLKHCKLNNREQLRLIEFFVAGTTARTAADLTGVHRNSAVRFFHKLREKIAFKQQNRSEQFVVGESNLMKAILEVCAKENADVGLSARCQFSAS
jgi:transposase